MSISRTFRLSDRLSVEIKYSGLSLFVEWDPSVPGDLTEEEQTAYLAARQEMIALVMKLDS